MTTRDRTRTEVRATSWDDPAGVALREAPQTGDRQPDAVRLYERGGRTGIPIFPPYEWPVFSIRMERAL